MMRFVIGVNDDYIDPDFTTENIGEAVDRGRILLNRDDVWKIDIEARRGDDDDTLLVIVLATLDK